jgi:hypothetical protein
LREDLKIETIFSKPKNFKKVFMNIFYTMFNVKLSTWKEITTRKMLKIGTFCFYCKTRVCYLRRKQEKENLRVVYLGY